ncbi:MAG TPA: glutamyl-tRNA reductase [Candidatus Binataceae bacterium]|nr:glutamyl-tRNA reductase [Candidatus Binataceae bacterium]
MEQALFILSVNHRTAPVALRERLAFGEDEVAPALRRLKAGVPAMSEAAILSTCNRVEIVGVATDVDRATEDTLRFLAADRQVPREAFNGVIDRLDMREAARHLFRVAASLDSMVVGEPQILGQVKLAYAQAAEAETVGLVLHRAFHRAFSVAKRVRNATLIGHGAVSVSSAAVDLASQIFDLLNDKTVMLMGAGRVAELTARHLKAVGVQRILITSRTFDHAVTLARELGGTAVPFDKYKPYLVMADIVIGSLAVTKPVLGPAEFEAIVRERRYRPMFLIDLGVPRNFDERLNSLENVYLYDMDDLGQMVQKSRSEREREAAKAEEIVESELDAFWRWLNGLDLVPTIKDIHFSIERLRHLELGRHRGWLAGLAPAERERVERVTRGLTNKLLHRILRGLRQSGADTPEGAHAAEVARRLLGGELHAAGGLIDGDESDEDGETEAH